MLVETQRPLVSVVMPVKRCNPCFLEKSIKSVLNQTLTDLELLLIIDADSRNHDKELLNTLEKFEKDRRMKILHNKTAGFVEALNMGLLAAKGTYIARMDGDDISLPNRLELQLKSMEDRELDFVGGWAYIINEQGETIGTLTPPTEASMIKRLIMLHNPFLHSSVIFRKSILKKTGLYNTALFGAEDYDLWLRFVSLGFSCANLSNFVISLRETRNSVLRGSNWRKTRASYMKAKALALTRLGYNDPLSITFCFAAPLSLMVGPKMALELKSLIRMFKKTPSNS